MVKCEMCQKEMSLFASRQRLSNNKLACFKCAVDWKKSSLAKQKSEKERNEPHYDPKTQVKEFKRTCKQCGKVWHVLESREKHVQSDILVNNLNVVSNCCNPFGGQLQAKRNVEANQTELDKLRKCPDCQSANYAEEVLIYDKKK